MSDSESMRLSIRGQGRTTGNGRKLQAIAGTDKAEIRKNGRHGRNGSGDRRKKREALALGQMPNPLSESRPAEPEPSGEGEANRDPNGTAVPFGDRKPETGKGTAMFRTQDRKRVEARRKPDPSPTGTE